MVDEKIKEESLNERILKKIIDKKGRKFTEKDIKILNEFMDNQQLSMTAKQLREIIKLETNKAIQECEKEFKKQLWCEKHRAIKRYCADCFRLDERQKVIKEIFADLEEHNVFNNRLGTISELKKKWLNEY